MLIIEIHVDTIEDKKISSTDKKREEVRPTRVNKRTKSPSNRFWDSLKLSIPGSLKKEDKNTDE